MAAGLFIIQVHSEQQRETERVMDDTEGPMNNLEWHQRFEEHLLTAARRLGEPVINPCGLDKDRAIHNNMK